MKWWWKMSEKQRTAWSVIILIIIAIVSLITIVLLIKWLVPFLFNTAIVIIGAIIVTFIFAIALNS